MDLPQNNQNPKVFLALKDNDDHFLSKNLIKELKLNSNYLEINTRSEIFLSSDYENFKGWKFETENTFLHYLTLGIYPQVHNLIHPLEYSIHFENVKNEIVNKRIEKAQMFIGITSFFPFWKIDYFTKELLTDYVLIEDKNFNEEKRKEKIALINLQIDSFLLEIEKDQKFKTKIFQNSKLLENSLPICYSDFDKSKFFPKELLNKKINSTVLLELMINEFDQLEDYKIIQKSIYPEINEKIPEYIKQFKWESGFVNGKKVKMQTYLPLRFKN